MLTSNVFFASLRLCVSILAIRRLRQRRSTAYAVCQYSLVSFSFGLIACQVLQCAAGEPAETQSLASRLAERRPIFEGPKYKCADMVWAVNELRRAGKPEAIRALKEFVNLTAYSDNKPRYDSLWLICRCLFEKPDGWPPFVGVPTLRTEATTDAQKHALRNFPLYPIAISNEVPFMLMTDYLLGGAGGSPRECIELCESLPMRKTDMPMEGFEAAAKALVESPQFAQMFAELYPTAEGPAGMAKMILNQARKTER